MRTISTLLITFLIMVGLSGMGNAQTATPTPTPTVTPTPTITPTPTPFMLYTDPLRRSFLYDLNTYRSYVHQEFVVGGTSEFRGSAEFQDDAEFQQGITVPTPSLPENAVPLGHAEANYLNVTGDTMEGPFDADGFEVTGIPDPIYFVDAVPKGWADGTYINTSGDTLTGTLTTRDVAIQSTYELRDYDSANQITIGPMEIAQNDGFTKGFSYNLDIFYAYATVQNASTIISIPKIKYREHGGEVVLDQVSIVVKDEQNTPYLDEIVFGYLSGDYQNKTEIRRIDTDWGVGTNGITTFDMLTSDHTVIDGASYYICVNPKSMSNNTDFNYRKITIKYHLE